MRKLKEIDFDTPIYKHAPHEEADLLVVGVNSTRGVIEEMIPRLEKDGLKVNHAQIRLLHPFPAEEFKPLAEGAKKIAIIEQNATGQLASIIKADVGYGDKIESILKYNGDPFFPYEAVDGAKKICGEVKVK